MFRLFSLSNPFKNWQREFESFLSNYNSKEELLIRTASAGIGCLFGLMTYLTNNPTNTGVTTGVFTLCNAILGSFLAYNAIVYPLYENETTAINSCHELVKEIKEGFYANDPLSSEKVKQILALIMSLSFVDEKDKTTRFKLHLLENFKLFLLHSNEQKQIAFMTRDALSILKDLADMQIYNREDKVEIFANPLRKQ